MLYRCNGVRPLMCFFMAIPRKICGIMPRQHIKNAIGVKKKIAEIALIAEIGKVT